MEIFSTKEMERPKEDWTELEEGRNGGQSSQKPTGRKIEGATDEDDNPPPPPPTHLPTQQFMIQGPSNTHTPLLVMHMA